MVSPSSPISRVRRHREEHSLRTMPFFREKSDARRARLDGKQHDPLSDAAGQRRLRILACWDYARPNWVSPLEGLVARGHEVIYVAYRTPADEPEPCGLPPLRDRGYWRDFRSGHHLLDEFRPDCVLMMGTEGAWAISTIFAARKRGVPTALLQHGVFSPVTEYESSTARVRAMVDATTRDRLPALRFLSRSLASRPQELARAVKYLMAASRDTAWVAAPRHPLSSRRVDRYLIASDRAGDFHRGMDHVNDELLRVVGLPEFDMLLGAQIPRPRQRSAVLLDTPHTGSPHKAPVISGEEKLAGLQRLGDELATAGWRLTVKLHPASFADAWAIDSDSLTFIRDASPIDVIARADVVIGFDSTLLVAAARHRPAVILSGFPSGHAWLGPLAVETGAVESVVDWRAVSPADVMRADRDEAASRKGRERFVEEVLGPIDGKALDRIEGELFEMARMP